ncbi:MAG TPA: T9SS type A sorting domain-containing protein [Luteibaculaceae bacterium]|nr:T9SS type A sorting domain-containing protein [Luteibaculaceae bacterium]
MKAIIIALSICLLAIGALAQSHKNIDVSLSCQTPLVANQTMDLQFSLFLVNFDGEFGDSIALEFDPGVTPNGSSSDPIATPTQGQSGEMLNGVSGQIISWGDNNDLAARGGIENRKFHLFTVNVTIDDTVTQPKRVRFYVSGDKFVSFPNVARDDEGFITLNLAEPKPDLALTFTCPLTHYFAFPERMLPAQIPLEARVENLGSTLFDQSVLVFDASSGSYFSSELLPRPFEGGASVLRSPSVPLRPRAGRSYNLNVFVQNNTDGDTTNQSAFCRFDVTDSTLSRTDGVATDSVSLLDPGLVGSIFVFPKADTLRSVSVYFIQPVSGDSVQVAVHRADVVPDLQLALSQTLVFPPGSTTGWYTLSFSDTVAISTNPVFIGVRLFNAGNTFIGVSPQNYTANQNFILPDGLSLFEPAENFGIQHENSYLMRLHVGSPPVDLGSTVGISSAAASALQIYPNPANEVMHIDGLPSHTPITIRRIDGQLMWRGTTTSLGIDVSQWPAGVYVLHVEQHTYRLIVTQ